MQIGIIDSGVGGLTVWKEITRLLPHTSTIYLADSANAPYGDKSAGELYSLSRRLVRFLIQKEISSIVIACNTISVHCLEQLRQEFPHVIFIGTVPAIKTAVEASKNRRIGIFSATATCNSAYQTQLIEKFARDCEVVRVGTDELVPLIEKGDSNSLGIQTILEHVLQPFREKQVDTIVLGCTHFPLLTASMQQILGAHVLILDTGAAIARQVKRVREEQGTVASTAGPSNVFYTTGSPEAAQAILDQISSNLRLEDQAKAFVKITL